MTFPGKAEEAAKANTDWAAKGLVYRPQAPGFPYIAAVFDSEDRTILLKPCDTEEEAMAEVKNTLMRAAGVSDATDR